MGAEGWPPAVTLPPSSGGNRKDGERRCKNKQTFLALWRCEAAASFMCSHGGSHVCGQYICWSEKSLFCALGIIGSRKLGRSYRHCQILIWNIIYSIIWSEIWCKFSFVFYRQVLFFVLFCPFLMSYVGWQHTPWNTNREEKHFGCFFRTPCTKATIELLWYVATKSWLPPSGRGRYRSKKALICLRLF